MYTTPVANVHQKQHFLKEFILTIGNIVNEILHRISYENEIYDEKKMYIHLGSIKYYIQT